jgi:hypothetical protein
VQRRQSYECRRASHAGLREVLLEPFQHSLGPPFTPDMQQAWEEVFEMISTQMLGALYMLSPQEERVSVAPISGIYSHSPLYKTAEAVLWLLQCRCELFAQYQHHQSEQKKKDCLKTTVVGVHL